MTARIPSTRPRGQLYARPEIAYIRVALELHNAADCQLPSCPVLRFGEFLEYLETQREIIGDTGRAQLWASLQGVLPRQPVIPPILNIDGKTKN